MRTPVRTLIVDDEPVARNALRELLAGVEWAQPVMEARDGLEALDAFRTYKPELVFLDVHLPVMSGIEALEQSGLSAAVVFTTAHDDAAITAFELGAIDYLLKPFGQERFALALARARTQLAALEPARGDAGNAGNAGGAEAAPLGDRLRLAQQAERPLTRLYVRDGRTVIPIEARDITRCEADGDYVIIHHREGRHHAYLNLRDLVAALDASKFVRVHRSQVVNLDFVAAITSRDANRVEVQMKDGTRVVASRTGTQALRAHTR